MRAWFWIIFSTYLRGDFINGIECDQHNKSTVISLLLWKINTDSMERCLNEPSVQFHW